MAIDYRDHHKTAYRHVSSLKDMHLSEERSAAARVLAGVWTAEELRLTRDIFGRLKTGHAGRSFTPYLADSISVLELSLSTLS